MGSTQSATANRHKVILLGKEHDVGLKVFNRLEFTVNHPLVF